MMRWLGLILYAGAAAASAFGFPWNLPAVLLGGFAVCRWAGWK